VASWTGPGRSGTRGFGEAADRLAVLIPGVESAVSEHVHGPEEAAATDVYARVHWLTAYTLFRAGERGESVEDRNGVDAGGEQSDSAVVAVSQKQPP
jgi:hypothetical protein